MGLKRGHTDVEIETLAKKFRESWGEGQVIRSWLRNHSGELRTLVREEDWSWTNIGRALSAAGIQFRTGKGWTGENVRRAVDLAVKPRMVREATSTPQTAAAAPATPTTPPSIPGRSLVPVSEPALSGEPEFRIIRRGPGAPARNGAGGTTASQLKRGEP